MRRDETLPEKIRLRRSASALLKFGTEEKKRAGAQEVQRLNVNLSRHRKPLCAVRNALQSKCQNSRFTIINPGFESG
jgi:hypothetical protein